MRNLLLFTLLFTFVVLFGCGDGKLKTIVVTGTVTLDGQPLEGATVSFSPKVEGVGHPAYGLTDANGRYKLQTLLGNADAGTTPGEYGVGILKLEHKSSDAGLSGGGSAPYTPPPKSLIPERYNSTATSGFTATVENKKKNVFDFELMSK